MSFNNQTHRRESSMESDGVSLLKQKYGRNIWHLRTSWKRVKDRRGEPDDVFCFFGFFVAVEFKNGQTPKKSHEALQNYNLMRIRDANGFAFVCRNNDDLLSAFERIHDLIKKRT